MRNTLVQLTSLSVDDPVTGWRPVDQERVAFLVNEFKSGQFGLTVACGVTILETEASDGKKIIDDGVSTVKALLACKDFFYAEQQEGLEPEENDATPIPKNLAAVFEHGLEVKVIKYTDDDDREARICWNVARHDEESFTVRWSSVSQKVQAAQVWCRRHGDWATARAAMLDFYGGGKEHAIGRWLRAAKGMDPETLVALAAYPKLKGSYVWDNSYLVLSSTRSRDKLSPAFAAAALQVAEENSAELTAATFVEKACKPMRLIEVWRTLMCKRYGSVASQSPALVRVVESLRSWAGLGDVLRCMQSGAVFHDANGIPECRLLNAEFDKCKAGGLPPPSRLPTEAEQKLEKEQAELRAGEAAKEAAAKEAAAKIAEEEAVRAAEADMFVFAQGNSGPSAGEETIAQPTAEEVATDAVNKKLENVHFKNTPEGFRVNVRHAPSARNHIWQSHVVLCLSIIVASCGRGGVRSGCAC